MLIPTTTRPNPTTKTSAHGYLRVPAAPVDDPCPHCGACNADERKHYTWRVADERGLHFSCDCCATMWFPDGRIVKPR